MFNNLRETICKEHSIKFFAEYLDVSEKTAQNKLNGLTEFTFGEFKRTCALFPRVNPVWLFESNHENKTA